MPSDLSRQEKLSRKHRLTVVGVIGAFLAGVVFFWVTAPTSLPANLRLETIEPDVANGQKVFWASGCASCHAQKGAKGDNKLLLGGGHRLKTPFGVFVTPNISPDVDTGIGSWNLQAFADSMILGQSPAGEHYYPAFPYSSYRGIQPQDLVDLFAYLKSLPAVSKQNEAHELPLQFRWRRMIGGWKWMFLSERKTNVENSDEQLSRGQYLVEVLGHCGECHTQRNFLGGLNASKKLAGGLAAEGDGKIPNITPHPKGIGDWSVKDITYYLESGFTPDFDSVGGSMVSVQENMSKLPEQDRIAIAKYLKSIPALGSE